jgi:hypothetical protein
MPELRATGLDPDERARLEASCADAMKLVGRAPG